MARPRYTTRFTLRLDPALRDSLQSEAAATTAQESINAVGVNIGANPMLGVTAAHDATIRAAATNSPASASRTIFAVSVISPRRPDQKALGPRVRIRY